MSRLFALQGEISKELLTYQGRVIVHSDRSELEFLVPMGAKVVECPAFVKEEEQLPIKQHPDCAHIRFPLHREDFRS